MQQNSITTGFIPLAQTNKRKIMQQNSIATDFSPLAQNKTKPKYAAPAKAKSFDKQFLRSPNYEINFATSFFAHFG